MAKEIKDKDKEKVNSETIESSEISLPKLAVKKEPTKVEHSFFTEVISEAKKEDNSKQPVIEKKEIINNIHLGEISKETLEKIKYPCIVRANFYAKELAICYQLTPNDDLNTALSTLRDAIFATQYNKDLPKNCFINSTKAYPQGYCAALQGAIGEIDGISILDATVEAYEIGVSAI
jgi:hypothetical protein